MEPTSELIDSIFRDKIKQARKQSGPEKMWAGPVLFAEACERMLDGIRWRHPDADEKQVQFILRQQLNRLTDIGV